MQSNKNWFIAYICIVFLLISVLSGCASAPKGSPKDQAYANAFQPEYGKALIYILRPYQFQSSGIALHPYLDYVSLGDIGLKQYVVATVAPGEHTISGEVGERTTIYTEQNAIYFFKIGIKSGMTSFAHVIEQLTEAEGKEMVKQYELAGTINNR